MNDEVSNIIQRFVSSSTSPVCFFRLSDEGFSSELKKSFYVIDASKDFSPYKPFLSLLQSKVCNDVETSIQKHAYSIHEETFTSFFKRGLCSVRYDQLLSNELVYEQSRFIKTIVQALECCLDSDVLITNCQCLFKESIDLIKALEESKLKHKIAFCFTPFKTDQEDSEVYKFFTEQSVKKNYLSLANDSQLILQKKNDYKSIFNLKYARQVNVIFNTLRNNRLFLSYEELKDFVLWINQQFNVFDFEKDDKRRIALELAVSLLQLNLLDESILYLNDIIDEDVEDDINAIALYYLSKAFAFKKAISLSQKYYSLADKALKNLGNSKYLALAAMLDFHISQNASSEDLNQKYIKAISLLEKEGLINNYISVCISAPWRLVSDNMTRKQREEEIEKCLKLAQKIDNQHLVSTACHWRGIVYSSYGDLTNALKWYDKCNEIRTRIGELGPILNIRNGLCYDATCRAMYKRAYDLENGIINRLIEVSDFATVADTLKNVSYALFYSRHFDEANDIFNVIGNYLRIFNMEDSVNNSFLPTPEDLLLFKTIICFDQKDYIRARVNYSNLIQPGVFLSREDKPFIHFVNAVLLAEEKKIEKAVQEIDECVNCFLQIKSKMTHKIIFAYYEFAVNLKHLGYNSLSSKYMAKGFALAQQNKYIYYTKTEDINKGKPLTVSKYIKGVEEFDAFSLNLETLNAKAEKEQLLTLLHKKIHDYQFINKLKSVKTQDMNIRRYVKTILLDLEEYTLANEVFFGAQEENGFVVFDNISHEKIPSVDPKMFADAMKSCRKIDNAQFVYNEKYKFYIGDMSYASYKFGIVIVPTEGNYFSIDMLNTLNIFLVSIQSQIVIYKQEEHLIQISSTDQLSQLNNRNAFQDYLQLEGERIRRYLQRKNTLIQVAVAFVDLDNFKYYNDTFGHKVGDLLIKSFANLLKETCRKIDFICRYGGDEFIIFMIDTNGDEGKRVFGRLKEGLVAKDYFIPDIEKFLGRNNLKIPVNRKIGFSMGISTNADVEMKDDLNQVVQNADKALYFSKENCKGSVSVWSDVKDLI